MLLKKNKVERFANREFIGPVGCLVYAQAYGLHHSWIYLGVVFLRSISKNFNTKLSSISFYGVTLVVQE
jgi:hypothetical protein